MDDIKKILYDVLNTDLAKIVFGGQRKKTSAIKKAILRPVLIKGSLLFQLETFTEKQAFHKNLNFKDAAEECLKLAEETFKQINIFTITDEIQILAAKVNNPRIIKKQLGSKSNSSQLFSISSADTCTNGIKENTTTSKCCENSPMQPPFSHNISINRNLSHNKEKQYLIPDGEPCDFLIELGVMGHDGKVFKKHYSKFRQINRYLEIVEDSLCALSTNNTLKIIDFGCGKAYLTFALYYYLKLKKGYDVQIIGLDLKADVIKFCQSVAEKLCYTGLSFHVGDIAEWQDSNVDMVITLHACDTATDYALLNAVSWGAKVILSVPCCQHELFSQIKSPLHHPLLKYGILKDKFTELLTDALRGLALEARGYDVSMIEFTTLEHTSKNILIKATLDPKYIKLCTKTKRMEKATEEYIALRDYYDAKPTTDKILDL